jgi:hypothetical protein
MRSMPAREGSERAGAGLERERAAHASPGHRVSTERPLKWGRLGLEQSSPTSAPEAGRVDQLFSHRGIRRLPVVAPGAGDDFGIFEQHVQRHAFGEAQALLEHAAKGREL